MKKIDILKKIKAAKISSAIIGLCVIIFGIIHLENIIFNTGNIYGFLAPNQFLFWTGSYQGLVTNSFVHTDIIHLLFNMCWAWILGSRLERKTSTVKYLMLIIIGSIVSNAIRILVSQQAGIGYSGIVYAFIGYGIFNYLTGYDKKIVTKNEIALFTAWLVIGFFLTGTNTLNIGNWSHAGGLFAGAAFGLFCRYKSEKKILLSLPLVIIILISCFSLYMPWSESWNNKQAAAAFFNIKNRAENGDIEAKSEYGTSLIMDSRFKEEGEKLLLESANGGSISGMNNIAWFYATTPNPGSRDGEEAVKWAEKACQATDYENAFYLDTLAAGHAALKQWERAVHFQTLAVRKYQDGDPDVLEGMNDRLALYKNDTEYIEN